MTAKIDFVIEKNLGDRVNFDPNGTSCTFNELFFKKSETFQSRKIKEVLDICHKHKSNNVNVLLIKSQEALTIWLEEKIDADVTSNQENLNKQQSESETSIPPNEQKVPTKKVLKKYRGQVYEEEVIDWEKIQQENQQNKPRRKYRGQYID